MKTEQILLAISAITGVGLLAWTIKQQPVAPSIPTVSGGQQNYPFPSWSQSSPVNTAAQFSPIVGPSISPPAPVQSAGKDPAYLTFNFPSDGNLQLPNPGQQSEPYSTSSVNDHIEPSSDDHGGCGCGCAGGCSCSASQGQMSTGMGKLLSALTRRNPDVIEKYAANTVSSGIALPDVRTSSFGNFSF